MSDTVPNSDTSCVPKCRCCCRHRWFLVGLAVILFIAAIFALLHALLPRTYTATAWIQVLKNKPYYIYEDKQRDYKSFVNTQFALMRSPLIIDRALENPVVAQLPEVLRQKDRSAWLAKNLKLQTQVGSEMMTVSFSAREPKAAEEIVNSVVNAYFDYYDAQSSDWNCRMINQLNLELNRHQNAARLLQDEIRNGLSEAARKGAVAGNEGSMSSFALGESLQRDLYLAEAKLEALRAELQAAKEFLGESVRVPEEVLKFFIEDDGEYIALVQRQKDAQDNLEKLQRAFDDSDSEVQKAKADVREALDRVTAYLQTSSAETVAKLQREMKLKVANTVWEKEVGVRTQELLVESLRSRYNDAVRDVRIRTIEIPDVSFQQEQLKRTNAVLDLLQSRVVSLQTEMNAPSQVQLKKKAALPTEPDRWW